MSPQGIRPLDKYVSVVRSFRSPNTIQELQSFLGLINYIGKWIPNLASLTEPLRKILKLKLGKNADISKYWKTAQRTCFNELKSALSKIKTLGYYDPQNQTQKLLQMLALLEIRSHFNPI